MAVQLDEAMSRGQSANAAANDDDALTACLGRFHGGNSGQGETTG
jgi:hypothetical protein